MFEFGASHKRVQNSFALGSVGAETSGFAGRVTALMGCLLSIGSVPAATEAIAATGQRSPMRSGRSAELLALKADWT